VQLFRDVSKNFLYLITRQKDRLSNFSFGAVSAVITCLALIISFDTTNQSKMVVIGSLCVIALADNISDTLGIHIYQEGEFSSLRKVWRATLSNFLTRLGVIAIFILFVFCLPPIPAVICSLVYGLLVLTIISYLVARKRKLSPGKIVLEHIIIAIIVLGLSKYITYVIKLLL
jgi:VIT1/CCC1 family predicted Fe2+/Mn2+ transporter